MWYYFKNVFFFFKVRVFLCSLRSFAVFPFSKVFISCKERLIKRRWRFRRVVLKRALRTTTTTAINMLISTRFVRAAWHPSCLYIRVIIIIRGTNASDLQKRKRRLERRKSACFPDDLTLKKKTPLLIKKRK